MITAVDSSVLVDVLRPDPQYGPRSRRALQLARSEGRLIACEVVWAEVSAGRADERQTLSAMEQLGIRFDAIDLEAAASAGRLWRDYRGRSRRRDRIVPDFLIGAHAMRRADRLLTRDEGFYRTYFRQLVIIDSKDQ